MFDPYAMLSSVISHELSQATWARAPQVQRFCGCNGMAERVVESSPNRDERSHAHFQFNLNRRCKSTDQLCHYSRKSVERVVHAPTWPVRVRAKLPMIALDMGRTYQEVLS